MSNGNGSGNVGKRIPPKAPKKRSRGEHPVRTEEARKVYYAYEFLGMSFAKAYDYAKPKNKAKQRSRTQLGKRLHDWYAENAPEDMLETLKLHGLDRDRLAQETNKRLDSMTLKNVKQLVEPKGKQQFKPFVAEITIDCEDNTTRMRATELLADMLGARIKKEEDNRVQVVILNPAPIEKPPGSGE